MPSGRISSTLSAAGLETGLPNRDLPHVGSAGVTGINEIADPYVDRWAELNPLGATFAGIPGHDDALTDFSEAGFTARVELERRTLAALAEVAPADDAERAAVESMTERLGLHVEQHEAGWLTSDLNVIDSPLQTVRMAFDLMPQEGEEALRNIARRLAAVPEALGQYRETLRRGAAEGRVSARRQVIACARQCADWADPGADNVYAGLVSRLDADGVLRSDLDSGAAAATRATAEFGRFLTDELLPLAPAKDAVGPDRYALASRTFLGAAVDLAETYAWGWDELHRLEAEMRRWPTRSCRAGPSGTRSRRWTPTPRAGSSARRRSATGCSSSPTRRSRSCTAATSISPNRYAGSSAASRPPALAASTTPARARTSAVPAGCGGRCRPASTSSPPGSRPRPSTTKAYRGITCRSRTRRTGKRL